MQTQTMKLRELTITMANRWSSDERSVVLRTPQRR
jgi:hypothetical protein